MQTRRPSLNKPITADVPTTAVLGEIHRRLVSIHHGLATGDASDDEVIPRALTKLDTLLSEIDDALTQAGA
jgi:hypothetical protein